MIRSTIPVGRRVPAAWICGALMLVAAATYAQERYAVLVGVGVYANLPAELHLKGPPNDARLAREYLLHVEGFDDDNIFWLADDASVRPTRANILDALEALDRTMRAGDFVLLHLSGHGSRQPARSGDTDERDGYDEIFLPADAADWDDSIGTVRNAITDNELGQYISSYRSKGVDVWLIVDSCHSGTMTRGVGDDRVVERFVDPFQVLDVPELSVESGAVNGHRAQGPVFVDEYEDEEHGMLVAFSAAHTTERAPEMPLPLRYEGAETRGLLSHNIFMTLSRFPGVSYRQLGQLVTSQYAAIPWNRSTPQFYGTDMDRVVFNGSEERATLFAAVWDRAENAYEVNAGALRGFNVGAGVAIHSDARDIGDNVIGSGTVVQAKATESHLDVRWDEGVDVPHSGATVYARLTIPRYSSEVVISLLNTKDSGDNERLHEIAERIAPGVPLAKFDDYREDADYFAAFFEDRFWLLRPGQSLPCNVRPGVSEEAVDDCDRTREPEELYWSTADDAEELVVKAARVRALTKLTGLSSPGELAIDVRIQRPGMEDPVSRGETPGALYPGDAVFYSVENASKKTAWDIFFFYVDSALGITALQALGSRRGCFQVRE